MKRKNNKTSNNPKGLQVDENTSLATGEVRNDGYEGTASDSNPSGESKSPLIVNKTIVKPNAFSLADIRLNQDFENTAGVRKVITQVRVDKPAKYVFFRVREEDEWCVDVWILEFKDDREIYLIHPNSLEFVGDLAAPTTLFTAITRNGDIFFLPVKLSKSDGRSDSWNESRRAAAELAKKKWLRMAANTNVGAYDIYEAVGNIPEPEWPDELTFEDLLNIAFKDKVIQGYDHPVLKKLRGEI